MVGVHDDGNAVGRGNGSNKMSTCDSTSDGGFLVLVVDTLASRQPGAHSLAALAIVVLLPTFPAKYAAPPWDACRIMGALASRAASRAATTVDEEVTFCSSQY